MGEAVTAFVVREPGRPVGEAELIAWARQRLAHFKAPSRIDFLAEIPRTATGKARKNVLREQLRASPTVEGAPGVTSEGAR
ncbi:AMP-binding enzyme [Millisia brevis]|uniref:AMP-binding enzyme n=1 Tax=Millisia brevis TaxID=264148 RepID=UPI0034E2EFAB